MGHCSEMNVEDNFFMKTTFCCIVIVLALQSAYCFKAHAQDSSFKHIAGNAGNPDQKIIDSYLQSDYVKTSELLEQRIAQLTEKASKGDRITLNDLYRKRLLLAHVYAWKLNKLDAALSEYQNVSALRNSSEDMKKFPHPEFLYVAEIYEMKKDLSKAKEHYLELLKDMEVMREKENDDVSILMSEELIRFIKYRIDGINLKNQTGDEMKLLLPKLKLSSLVPAIYTFLALMLVPSAEIDMAVAAKTDLTDYIKQSPENLNSMIFNYMLIVNASASMVDESSEKAMKAYIDKYPESYYSLLLRYMFYKFYKENGQDKKAEELLKGLEKVAGKRGIEIITSPDKRFSSPENTWTTYKKAFSVGDIDTLAECYVPGAGKIARAFRGIDREKMKEIGEAMGDIQRVTGNEGSAKYRIKRKEKIRGEEMDITYYILFQNIDGEWKMQEF